MRHAIKATGIAVLACTVAACGGQSADGQAEPSKQATPNSAPSQGPSSGDVAQAGAAPAAFAQCLSCHAVQPGRNGIGPSLAGIAGRKAATVPGFAYSPALTASGLTWDRPTLDRWLAAPMKTVPGTRMIYAGISDPARRKDVIDYLETLK